MNTRHMAKICSAVAFATTLGISGSGCASSGPGTARVERAQEARIEQDAASGAVAVNTDAVTARLAGVSNSRSSHSQDHVAGDQVRGSAASAAGDHANAITFDGGSGPLLVAVIAVVLVGGVCVREWVKALRADRESHRLRAGLVKLMRVIDEHDQTDEVSQVKQVFERRVSKTPAVAALVEDILDAEVRPHTCHGACTDQVRTQKR